jgi:hypothetical protein
LSGGGERLVVVGPGLDADPQSITTVAIVDRQGHVWCEARYHTGPLTGAPPRVTGSDLVTHRCEIRPVA